MPLFDAQMQGALECLELVEKYNALQERFREVLGINALLGAALILTYLVIAVRLAANKSKSKQRDS